MKFLTISLLALPLMLFSSCANGPCKCNKQKSEAKAIQAKGKSASPEELAKAKPYPLDKCLVMDVKLKPKETITKVYKGQQMKFCCVPCVIAFENAPEKYMAMLKKH